MYLWVLIAACTRGDDGDDGPTDGTPTGTTGDTGETGTTSPIGCDDAIWIPGAFWTIDISVPPGKSTMATDLAVDAAGEPVVLVNDLVAGRLELRFRSPGDPPYQVERTVEWAGFDGRAPAGDVLGLDADGAAWVGGRVGGESPFAARFDLGAASGEGWALDPGIGEVTAGPVFTTEGAWFAGTVLDPAVGEPEIVVWRVDDQVHEVHRIAGLPDGDAGGTAVAEALAATDDGRIVLGGGWLPSGPTGARAALWQGDAAGFTEVASLEPSETGDVPGVITSVAVRGDTLSFTWGARGDADPAGPGWIVLEGPLSDPASAAVVDQDGTDEHALPRDVTIHPSGAVIVGGERVPSPGAMSVPYIRVGVEGTWTTSFEPYGIRPGWISSVGIEPDGDAWGLCLFSDDGIVADNIELIHLACRL